MTRRFRSLFIAVIAIATALPALAADRSQRSYSQKQWDTAEKNYVNALIIGNEGSKISAAGFLADYGLRGGVPALIRTLRTDKTENVRISAALALIMLDEKEGREAVEESSLYDGSDRVAKFCEALLKVQPVKGRTPASE